MKNTIAAVCVFFAAIAGAIAMYFVSGSGECATFESGGSSPLYTGQAKEVTACDATDLKAEVQFEGAAGSIYGRFSITNISTESCAVEGKNFVQIDYDADMAKNIDIVPSGLPAVQTYALAPSASVWALIRMPNGPQCDSAVNQVNVGYSYSIGGGKSVTFTDAAGKSQFIIQVCAAPADRTRILITNMSDQMPENGQGL